MTKIVYTVEVKITEEQLQEFINILNKWEINDDEKRLTIEEVRSNHELLKYICEEAVEDGVAIYDPLEFWNNDGWCDFRDYR